MRPAVPPTSRTEGETQTAPGGAVCRSTSSVIGLPRPETSTPDTSPRRGQLPRLLITDHLIAAGDVDPLARVLTAAVLRWRGRGNPSYTDLAAYTRSDRKSIPRALREAEARGWLTIDSGRNRKPKGQTYYPKNRYRVAPHGDPRTEGVQFVQLALTTELGAAAAHWMLRAVYLREQRITGAVQLPDAVAARAAGMNVDAVKKARRKWMRAGSLRLVQPSDFNHPPTYTLQSAEHPSDLERFNPDHRRLRRLTLPSGARLTTWGTRKQHAKINGLKLFGPMAATLEDVAREKRSPFDAAELIPLLESTDEVAYYLERSRRHDEEIEARADFGY